MSPPPSLTNCRHERKLRIDRGHEVTDYLCLNCGRSWRSSFPATERADP